jgi:hypothetical protein
LEELRMNSTKYRKYLISSVMVGLIYCSFPLAAKAAAAFDVGTFTTPTSTGTQAISHNLGVTPKALIIFITHNASFNNSTDDVSYAYGFTDGTTSGCVTYGSDSAAAAGDASAISSTKVLTLINEMGTKQVEASWSAWNSSTFTLNFTTADAARYMHYMVIGGSDVSAKVVSWTVPTATGNKVVTGVGFQPDVVFHLNNEASENTQDALMTNAKISLGVMDSSGNQWASSVTSSDGDDPSDTFRYQRINQSFVSIGDATTYWAEASFVSMDANGFTVNFTTAQAANKGPVYSLCLDGVQAKAGSFTKSTDTGAPDQSVTGIGFTPSAIFFASVANTAQTTRQTNAALTLGMTDGTTSEASASFWDDDNLATTLNTKRTTNTKAYMQDENSTSGADSEADLKSLDSDGFTLDWTANSSQATEICYLALSSSNTLPGTPSGLTAVAGNGQVYLKWAAVAGATSYTVKRSTSSGGPYSNVVTGETNTYYTNTGLTNETTYYYVVSATNGTGEGSNSSEASATPTNKAVFSMGTYQTPASTGQQTITHTLGMTPKAVIVYASGNSSLGSTASELQFGYGFTDGTTSRSVSINSDDGAGTSDTNVIHGTKILYLPLTGDANTIGLQVAYVSWNTTTVTLDFQDVSGGQYYLHYIVIGGNDVSAKVLEWTMPTATGNKSVTGAGFQPDVVMNIVGRNSVSSQDVVHARAAFGLSVMDKNGYQWATDNYMDDAIDGSDTSRYLTSAKAFAQNNASSINMEASYVSMDYDGFTINFSNADAGAVGKVFSLCLKGLSVRAGTFTKSADTSGPDQSFTGFGFSPKVVMMAGVSNTSSSSIATHGAFTFGAAMGSSLEASVSYWDQDNVGASNSTDTTQRSTSTKIFSQEEDVDTTIESEADLKTLDSDGFTIDWTTNSATQTEIAYLAFGVKNPSIPRYYKGSFDKATATGNQTVSHSLGVQPKAIIFWSTINTSEAATADAQISLGMTVGPGSGNSSSISGAADGSVATSNTSSRIADKAITMVQQGEATLGEADLSSWSNSNFVLNWTTANASAYKIHFLAIGGDDVSAELVSWTKNNSVANQAVTGAGFQPDVVFHMNAQAVTVGSSAAGLTNAFGVMDKNGNQWAMTFDSLDNQAISDSGKAQVSDNALIDSDKATAAIIQKLNYVSMDSDGFTVNVNTTTATAPVRSLCLKGVVVKVGKFNKDTGAATVDQNVTDVGFTPSAVFLASAQSTTSTAYQNGVALGIGAASSTDGAEEGCAAITDDDNADTTSSYSNTQTDKAFMVMDSASTVDAEADLKRFNTNGFTLSWTVNDNVATEICYVAFGQNVDPMRMGSTRLSSNAVQHGSATIANGSASTTASITAVDLTKSFLVFGVSGSDASPENILVSGKMTASNELTFTRIGTVGNVTIKWHVAEFATGVRVQRGTTSFSGSVPKNVTLSQSVSLSKAVPIISYTNTGAALAGDDLVRAKITTTTNLEITADAAPSSTNEIAWQVIEFTDATVSTGDVAISTGQNSNTGSVTIRDLDKAWLLYSYYLTTDATGSDMGQNLVRGRITSNSVVTFDRDHRNATASAQSVTWYVVEFSDNTVVQRGTQAFASGDTSHQVNLSPEVERANSIACAGYNGTGGITAYSAADNPGYGWFSLEFENNGGASPDNDIVVTRGVSGATADLGWFVIQFHAATTEVKLTSWAATSHKNGTLFQWSTEYEVDNLGFNIYRELNGTKVKLTDSIIAGSSLMTPKGELTSGRSYKWRTDFQFDPSTRFWLEDLDLNGKSTMHGPITAQASKYLLVKKGNSESINTLARVSTAEVSALSTSVASIPIHDDPAALPQSDSQSLLTQWRMASQQAIKIAVDHPAWYRVTQAELLAAGLNPYADPRNLQMYVDGRQMAINVVGDQDRRFDSTDYIEFYGKGIDSAPTNKRVYWLVQGTTRGLRTSTPAEKPTKFVEDRVISRHRSPARPTLPAPARAAQKVISDTSFITTTETRERKVYFSAFNNGDSDNFFGPVISSTPLEQKVKVYNLDRSKQTSVELEVNVVGITSIAAAMDHNIEVKVNGNFAGYLTFDGRETAKKSFNIPAQWVQAGENSVTLKSLGGAEDLSLADSLKLKYFHTYTADADALLFTASGNGILKVNGFSSSSVKVFDVTDPYQISEVTASTSLQAAGGQYTANIPVSGQNRKMIALTESRVEKPASLTANQPTRLNNSLTMTDIVILSHSQFKSAVDPLKSKRESQGKLVTLVDIEDVYDEFGYGVKSVDAVKAFIRHAVTKWKKAPEYCVLVGDASFDPLNRLGMGSYDFVPTKMLWTTHFETSSDDWIGDVDNDGIAEVAMGRLPVRTADEAKTVVDKIIAYENRGRELTDGFLLVTDKNDKNHDFETAGGQLKQLLPLNTSLQEIKVGQTTLATARTQLIAGINSGPKVVNYIGHGSVAVWTGAGLLKSADARTLTNGEKLPLFIMMNCLNGFYHDVWSESLAESLMKAPGGAVAVWASSGLTGMTAQTTMNQEFYRLLYGDKKLTIGEMIRISKASISDQDIRRTWIFFGDPSMKIK